MNGMSYVSCIILASSMVAPEHCTTFNIPRRGPAVSSPPSAGDVGHHRNAHALEVFADDPDLAGQVEVAQVFQAHGRHVRDVAVPISSNMARQAAA
jgi:hypothetical protein